MAKHFDILNFKTKGFYYRNDYYGGIFYSTRRNKFDSFVGLCWIISDSNN